MKRHIEFAPNILTCLRIVLTPIFLLTAYQSVCFKGSIVIPLIAAAIIYISDFFDGILARRLNTVSKLGARLDLTADFIFILFANILFVCLNLIPSWFIAVIVIKFIEFIISSRLINNCAGGTHTFCSDFMGRIAANIFYAMPAITLVVTVFIGESANEIILYLTLLTGLFAIISSMSRLSRCLKAVSKTEVNRLNKV